MVAKLTKTAMIAGILLFTTMSACAQQENREEYPPIPSVFRPQSKHIRLNCVCFTGFPRFNPVGWYGRLGGYKKD
jgi:hypothetical protein